MEWLGGPQRLPLVVRGARQVGKTWLVREAVRTAGRDLLELNLERDPAPAAWFDRKDPIKVIRALEAHTGKRVDVSNTVLFIDEIQAAPNVFAALRWFAEEMPALPVVAAGSLLDFVLADHSFSMPVGRISYLHLEPMTFEEFLAATGNELLLERLQDADLTDDYSGFHSRLSELFQEYVVIGGMPAAVLRWCESGSLLACAEVQEALLTTYRDDFAKYSGRIPASRLERVLSAVPRLLGRKFVYSQVDRDSRSTALAHALDLLCKARLCSRVQASHATGLPLSAEIRERVFKVLFVDVGMVAAALGVVQPSLPSLDELLLVNRGGIAEQAVGQALRALTPRFREPRLFYWARDRKGSEAELDYVLQHGLDVVPIEVKAGKTGALKSLHLFMGLRGGSTAVRFWADLPSVTNVDVRTTEGLPVTYRLLSLPLYMAGQLSRLLAALA